MMSLAMMALNPNLSPEQFRRLAAEYMDAKDNCFRILRENVETMEPEAATQYLLAVLPLLMTW